VTPRRAWIALALLLALVAPSAARAADPEAAPTDGAAAYGEDAPASPLVPAREVIERAFANFYYCDLRADLVFDVRRRGRSVLRYDTELMRKFIDGRAHDLFYFEGDGDTRGRRVLRIERIGRADDAFVYLPQLRRIRRTVMAQSADKMLGMEVTLEDLEVLRADDFELLGSSMTQVEGEPARIVTLRRLAGGAYDRVDFFVAAADAAILEVRFYRRDALEPYKQTRMRRADMQRYPGHVLPSRIEFVDREAGTETLLVFARRAVNPELPSDRFTTLGLEKRQHLSWIHAPAERAE
jgi:hypothetical protein